MQNIVNLLADLERIVEEEELRKIGLTEEEIEGYFDFYFDSWVKIAENLPKEN